MATAVWTTLPMPARPNTVSVMSAPPRSSPTVSAMIVTTGSAEGLSRCAKNRRARPSPRA